MAIQPINIFVTEPVVIIVSGECYSNFTPKAQYLTGIGYKLEAKGIFFFFVRLGTERE